MKKKNRSKFFSNFFESLGYLKYPFFKFGQKTSQQLTNWSIFLSLFVMSVSLAQISFETRNSRFFKNYPVFLKSVKIPQKFETFYLQLPSAYYPNQELEEKSAIQKRKKAEKLWFENIEDEEQKLFIDFHRYIEEEEPKYPTIFNQILNSRQKQDAINLYHTFEEITPLLLSEKARERDERKKTPKEQQEEEEAIFQIGGYTPAQNWSSETQNFEKEKVWRFRPPTFKTFTSPFTLVFYRPLDDKDVIIHDYKKEKNKNFDRSSNFVQTFFLQYEKFLKKNKNNRKFFVKNRIFPFENIEICQNNDKIVIPTLYNKYKKLLNWTLKHQIIHLTNPFIPLSDEENDEENFNKNQNTQKKDSTLNESTDVPKKKEFPPLEDLGLTPSTIPFSEKKERIGSENIEQILKYIIASSKPKPRKDWGNPIANSFQLLVDRSNARILTGKQLALRKKTLAKAAARYEAQQAYLNVLFRMIFMRKKPKLILKLKKYELAELLLETFYKRGPTITIPSQFDQHKKHIARLEAEAEIPSHYTPKKTIDLFNELEEVFHQIHKIKDQIPQKLQEFRLDPQYLERKRKRKSSIFIKDTEYEPERVESFIHTRKSVENFIEQVSRPHYHPLCIIGPDGNVQGVRLYRELLEKKESLFGLPIIDNPTADGMRESLFQCIELIEKQWPEFRETDIGSVYYRQRKLQAMMPHIGGITYRSIERTKHRSIERTKLRKYRYKIETISRDEMEKILFKDPMALRRYGYPQTELGEKITHKGPRGRIYWDNFDVYFDYPLPCGAGYEDDPNPVELERLVELMRWRAEKNTDIVDEYFPRFSTILEKVKKNRFFDFHFLAEDYLLESIYWNLSDLFQDFKKKRKLQLDSRRKLRQKTKSFISSLDKEENSLISLVAFQVLDFLDQKEILKNQIFQHYKRLINQQKFFENENRQQISLFSKVLLKQTTFENYFQKLFDNKVGELEECIEDGDFFFLESISKILQINLQKKNFVCLRENIQTQLSKVEYIFLKKTQLLLNKIFSKKTQFLLNKFLEKKEFSQILENLLKFRKHLIKPRVQIVQPLIWDSDSFKIFKDYFSSFNPKIKVVYLPHNEKNPVIRTSFPFELNRLWFQKVQQPLTSTILQTYPIPEQKPEVMPKDLYIVHRVLPRIPKNKDALNLAYNVTSTDPLFKKTKDNPYPWHLFNASVPRPWKVNKFKIFDEIVAFSRSIDFHYITHFADFYDHFLLHLKELYPELLNYYLELDSFPGMESEEYSILDLLLKPAGLAEDEKERQKIREEQNNKIRKFNEFYQQEIQKKRNEYDKIQNKKKKRKIKAKNQKAKSQKAKSQKAKSQKAKSQKEKNLKKQTVVYPVLYQTIVSILEDAEQNLPEFNQKHRQLSHQKKIYETSLVRAMSGYFFPDIKSQKFPQIFRCPTTLEISLKQVNLSELAQKFPKNHITPLYPQRSSNTPSQIFHHQHKISQTQWWDTQFFEFRENFQHSSWSVIFFFSSGWIFINIFKNLYKKYVKEFVESGLDVLKRAGILDDIQWIKEELGIAPIDKGYRGIRHHGKKLRNIIGINQKQRILQISEIVWFLKTKKLLHSPDPFVQMIVFIHRSEFFYQTKLRLILQRTPRRGLPFSLYKILLTLRTRTKIRFALKRTSRRFFPFTALGPAPTERQYNINKRLDQNKKKIPPTKELRPLSFRFKRAPLFKISWLNNPAGTVTIKPKGYLLTGPPGTGKTLLVQAIAGETCVPVVTQSGGLLQKPRLGLEGCGAGARTLHKLFLRAREIAPCMIFIDEIDGIGKRRQFFSDHRYDSMEWLDSEEMHKPPNPRPQKIQRRSEFFDDHDPYWKEPELTQTVQSTRVPLDVRQDLQFSRGARTEQLNILTQLLIELDGIHALDNIVVIGATNRLEILDPALMRPGRFQKILQFHLPDYGSRMNLLKFYIHHSKIGVEDISWDYFSKRTNGLSSADIASIVFASELTAVEKGHKHTFDTLERGVDLITSFPCDPIMFRLKNVFQFLENSVQNFYSKNTFYPSTISVKTEPTIYALQEISTVLRHSYYNIGKMVLLFYLEQKQIPLAYISLWQRPKNFRFFFFAKNFHEFEQLDQQRISKKEIEKRLVALFGGKASESFLVFLPLQKFTNEICFRFDSTFLVLNNSVEQSNLGMESDLQSAQRLLKLMVEEWYFYLERIATEKFHPILENVNLWEYMELDAENTLVLGETLVDEMMMNLDMRNQLSTYDQKHSYQTWWLKKVATQLNYRESWRSYLQWSRIQLSDPKNSSQNIEWVPPDEYFHTTYRTCSSCMAWSHYLENRRFALSNVVFLQSFNSALKMLRPFLEFIDFLSDYFLRQGCIREKEFHLKIQQFFSDFDDLRSLS